MPATKPTTKLTAISIRWGDGFRFRFIQAEVSADGRVRVDPNDVWDLFDLEPQQRPRRHAVWNAREFGIY